MHRKDSTFFSLTPISYSPGHFLNRVSLPSASSPLVSCFLLRSDSFPSTDLLSFVMTSHDDLSRLHVTTHAYDTGSHLRLTYYLVCLSPSPSICLSVCDGVLVVLVTRACSSLGVFSQSCRTLGSPFACHHHAYIHPVTFSINPIYPVDTAHSRFIYSRDNVDVRAACLSSEPRLIIYRTTVISHRRISPHATYPLHASESFLFKHLPQVSEALARF